MRKWVKVTIAKELREFQAYMEVERHPRDIKGRKAKAKDDLHDIAEECDWLKSKVDKFIAENTTIPFSELMIRIEETRELIVAANIDLDTIELARSKPDITYGKYELSEVHGEHTRLHPVTPKEMVQNDIRQRLINNEENQRLTEELMKSIVVPYTNQDEENETEENETSFQKEINEHERQNEII